jgi:hypothetical protein
MMRAWRHLRMLKRSGRGHDPAGVSATKEGECAILCPACPQPGINLPSGWEQESDRYVPHATLALSCSHCPLGRWKYALFLALDANFRLTRKKVSNNIVDPGLSKGWSYFVNEGPYKQWLATAPPRSQVRNHTYHVSTPCLPSFFRPVLATLTRL